MEVSNFSSCLALPKRHYSFISPSQYKRRTYGVVIKKSVITAEKSENDRKSIDENMIVLRMRIKKMKALEASSGDSNSNSQEMVPDSNWTNEWENNYSRHYKEDVCEGVGLLHSYLMNTRPSVALGLLTLIAMSIPLSTSVLLFNILKVAKELLAGSHVCIDINF